MIHIPVRALIGVCKQIRVAEGEHAARLVVHENQGENRHQHDEAGRLGENEELELPQRGAAVAAGNVVAPECNQEEHGHQHHFPEQEEQEQIGRQEHADDAAQGPQ
jgi:hypothetical protein